MANPYASAINFAPTGRTPVPIGGRAFDFSGGDYSALGQSAINSGASKNQVMGSLMSNLLTTGLEEEGATYRANSANATALTGKALDARTVLNDARQRNRTARQMQLDAAEANKPGAFQWTGMLLGAGAQAAKAAAGFMA